MSKRSSIPGPGKLPLPTPRSPRALDDRILEVAREYAPKSRPRRQPWWMAGAATASVLVIAVMLVQPQRPSSIDESEMEVMPAAARDSAMGSAAPETNAINELKVKRSPRSEMDSELESVDRASSQPASSAPVATGDFFDEEIAAEQSNLALPARKTRANSPLGPKSEQGLMPLTDTELREELRMLAKLFQQGDKNEANERYERLKQRYPDHDLPETLEEALAEALADKLGDIPAKNPEARSPHPAD